MELLTKDRKIEVLEHSFTASAGAYYNINLSKDLVPGYMYQIIDDKEYNLNEQMGLSENASFTDVVEYWGKKLDEKEKTAYYEFFSIPRLLECYDKGEKHVFHRYWTKSAIFESMLAEQHIVMYTDEETQEVLAITYVLDLTYEYKKEQYKKELEEKQKILENALQESEKARKYEHLQNTLKAVDEILDNLAVLDNITSEKELNEVLPRLLASLGHYAKADRAYLFSWALQEKQILKMTHEWCAQNVRPTIDEMQHVSLTDMPNWSPKLENKEAIISLDWDAEKNHMPEEYTLFDGQDIHSLIVIPVFANNKLNGYIGFDNPEPDKADLSVRMLTSIGGHIGGLKENLRMMAALEKKQSELENSFDELNQEKKILSAMSVDYLVVSLCDFEQDTLYHLKKDPKSNLEMVNQALGGSNHCFSDRIKCYYENFIVKESAPDFLEKVNLTYLKEYLKNHERFAYSFRAKANPAGRQHFELQIVPLTGSSKFVMGFRYMDDLVEEREKQKAKLENALAEANLNSEIINSIGKIYWLIYRIDLRSGTYEEISAGEEMHHFTGKQGKFGEAFRNARETVVESAYQESMEQFLDTSTLPERLKDTESVSEEYQATNGSWHRARFIVKKRDESGKVTHVLYVVREIDQEKKKEIEYKKNLLETTEKAEQANKAKTEFLRRMSHDIRTPINGIIGLLNINKTHFEDRELVRENQEKMEVAATHLLSLINDVLQMSKIEDGSVVLAHEKINLYEMSEQIAVIIEERAAEKGIKVEMAKDKPFAYPYVYGSPLHLRQIFINICDNCIKYNCPGGKLEISVDVIEKRDDHCIYQWIISDTGIGMSEEFLEHIFEPFVQEKDDARSTYMGVGLGMSIVKGLIDQMGGTICVSSKEGVGSVFVITIPFDLAYVQDEPAERITSERISIRGMNLMLVEDNELNAEIAETMLVDQGANITVAENGKEAVDLFTKNPAGTFDAILMDIMMPVMDGLTATKEIRALQHPDAGSIPIIAMTANAFQEDAETCMEAGMNAHLTKPLDMEQVKRSIYINVKSRNNEQ